jgi:hypothetical protein
MTWSLREFYNLKHLTNNNRDIKKRLIDTAQDKDNKDGNIKVDDKKAASATGGCC